MWLRLHLGVLVGIAFAAAASRCLAAPEPNPESGRKIYAACAACHENADAPNRGPSLRGVVGRPAGSVRGFLYSRAMKNAKRTWNEPGLAEFLANPQAALPGTTMPFPGLSSETDRRDLIAWLKSMRGEHFENKD